MDESKKTSGDNFGGELELRKSKLRAEFGAGSEPQSDEVEGKKRVAKVNEVLGGPSFRKFEDLSDQELKEELQKVLEFMDLHDIHVNVIYDVDPTKLYEFVTTELLEQEVEMTAASNRKHLFIYEEFHPNHHEDIKRESIAFLQMLLKQDFEFINYHCADKLLLEEKELPLDQFIDKVTEILDQEAEIILPIVEVKEVRIGETKAKVSCVVQLERVLENQPNQQKQLSADVYHYLDFGFWSINQVMIPDLGLR